MAILAGSHVIMSCWQRQLHFIIIPVVAVWVEAHPGGEDDGVELVLDLDVGVAVGVEHLPPLARPVANPLVQPRTEVLQHVRLSELGALQG